MKCLNCGFEYHADLNSCRNHLNRKIPQLTKSNSASRTTGFFWNKEGVTVCDERPDKKRKRLEKEANANPVSPKTPTPQPLF